MLSVALQLSGRVHGASVLLRESAWHACLYHQTPCPKGRLLAVSFPSHLHRYQVEWLCAEDNMGRGGQFLALGLEGPHSARFQLISACLKTIDHPPPSGLGFGFVFDEQTLFFKTIFVWWKY